MYIYGKNIYFYRLYKSIKIIINLKVIIYFNNNVNMIDKTFQNFKKYIVENKYKTVRKRKYSFDYYIKCFIKMLSDYNNWDIYKKQSFL